MTGKTYLHKDYGEIKNSRFPLSLFFIYYGVLFLMSGIHVGLVVLALEMQLNTMIQVGIPMVYWGLVAAGLTLFTRRKIRATYERPLHELAKATDRVANGDFSVHVPVLHEEKKLDYLDIMILDFNKMVEELGSIETLKTDFISNVSHEMKTPIAIVKNSAEMLKSERLTQEQRREYIDTIDRASRRLSDLIGNVLKLSRLENQKIVPEPKTYDVCRQICECAIQFEDAWEARQIDLEIDLEDSAFVKADAGFLELVWNNLLSNAIKFTEPGGAITIRQSSDESQVRVSVSDTGCGMSPESLKHIFDKFYQGDTSHSKEGNGLGLAMVKQVLELSNGKITVESEAGRGSVFTVILPR